MKRYRALAALAGGLLGTIVGSARGMAQDAYPTRRVTIVVPSPAGSTTDSLARLVADQLQRKWGSTVIVENNGRGLNFGAEQVARAPADGYTLLVTAPMPLTFANLLYRDIGYQSSQFVPVSLLAKIPNVLAVRKGLPAKDVKELVAFAKANPGKITYASSAAGSTAHLSGAQLEVRGGIKMTHIPYRGSAPAHQRSHRRPCRPVLRYADDLGAAVARRQDQHPGGGKRRARRRGERTADDRRVRLPRLPLDHLVRHGGAAEDAGCDCREDQPRHCRDSKLARDSTSGCASCGSIR